MEFRSTQPTKKVCQDICKKRRRTSSLATSKKRRRLLAFSPTEDPARRLEQLASLGTTLTATGAQFSNDLTFISGMAPKSGNNPAYEKEGMQILSREDTESLNLCKTMMKRGECPPKSAATSAKTSELGPVLSRLLLPEFLEMVVGNYRFVVEKDCEASNTMVNSSKAPSTSAAKHVSIKTPSAASRRRHQHVQ
ncbi:hypothetical protein Tco_1502792 [Tanacetum coccineum]